ncbi:MAG: DUF2934 domain-containing protein [Gemmatimonadetes bacterium]|nr:DUF2934 domain-containing protein [Gemmatimonadota bacterium]
MPTERKKKGSAKAAGKKTPAGTEPSESEIRERAYEISQLRGGEPGHELEDWLQAKRELGGDGKRS